MSALRSVAALFRRTPLHPQWLLGRRYPPKNIAQTTGVVLDIGAADKWIEKYLSSDVRYISLDYPATGRDMYQAAPAVFSDAAQLPFGNDTFNGVICLEVLEHVVDPSQVMREISRVLKPGGRAWLSMPFLYPLHDAPFDFQRYTEYGLRRDVQRAGLTVVSLHRRGSAIKTVGLLACLAIAGALYKRNILVVAFLLPLAAFMVFSTNIAAYAMSMLWPDWHHLSAGHELEVSKLSI